MVIETIQVPSGHYYKVIHHDGVLLRYTHIHYSLSKSWVPDYMFQSPAQHLPSNSQYSRHVNKIAF